jgi:hypothetical protein
MGEARHFILTKYITIVIATQLVASQVVLSYKALGSYAKVV